MPTQAVFIQTGRRPAFNFAPSSLERDPEGRAIAGAGLRTSLRNVFAAGDTRSGSPRTLAAAMADGRLAAALAKAPADPVRAAEAVGRAYLAFARQEPAFYAAMFEARIAREPFPELQAAGDRAFGVLRALAERLTAAARIQPRPPALMIALHIWSTAHGIAALFGRADPSRRPLPMTTEDLLESSVLIYLQGLGIVPGGG